MTNVSGETGRVFLHLRIRAAPGQRAALLAFLREATPLYERPGGIRMHLLESADAPDRFVEIVEYADGATFARDQERVHTDPELMATLARWRTLLAGAVDVETWIERDGWLRGGGIRGEQGTEQ